MDIKNLMELEVEQLTASEILDSENLGNLLGEVVELLVAGVHVVLKFNNTQKRRKLCTTFFD